MFLSHFLIWSLCKCSLSCEKHKRKRAFFPIWQQFNSYQTKKWEKKKENLRIKAGTEGENPLSLAQNSRELFQHLDFRGRSLLCYFLLNLVGKMVIWVDGCQNLPRHYHCLHSTYICFCQLLSLVNWMIVSVTFFRQLRGRARWLNSSHWSNNALRYFPLFSWPNRMQSYQLSCPPLPPPFSFKQLIQV